MKFLTEGTKAVLMLACDKHASILQERIHQCREGNWFVLPAATACLLGYRAHVSEPHAGEACAIMGFAETKALSQALKNFSVTNEDGSLCCNCVAYQWDITPYQVTPNSQDLVCGRKVTCDDAVTTNYNGELFCFCSVGCRDRFRSAPEEFLRKKKEASTVEV